MDLDRRPSDTFYFKLHDERFNDNFGFFGHSVYMKLSPFSIPVQINMTTSSITFWS